MPMYCTNCGAQMSEAEKFCSSCGSSLNIQSGSPPATPQERPSSQQPSIAGAPLPETKPSSRGLKVVFIALGVIALLVVVFVVGLGMLLKRVFVGNIAVKEKAGRQSEVSITVPGGEMKVTENPRVTEETLGVPIYPGAKLLDDSGSVRFSGSDAKGSSTIGGASFTTRDPVNAVVEFYKGKLGRQVNIMESTTEGKHAVVNVTTDKGWKTITVEDQGDGVTKVSIATMTGSSTR